MPQLIAAVHTPFAPDGGLRLESVAAQAAMLADGGVHGAFVAGTTGESLSLTVAERMALAEAWVGPARRHGLRLLVHVGAAALADAVALARHAGQLGVDSISAMAPCYFKPPSCGDLADFLATIAAAAPQTPFYYYDIPSWTGVTFRSSELLERHAAAIPTLAGIKYTSADLADFERCVAVGGGRYAIYWGTDEALLAGLVLGAAGAIGSTYNFAAAEALAVMDAFAVGDMPRARAAQLEVVRIVDLLAGHGYMRAAKAVLGMLGVDCGTVRSPLRPPNADELASLRRDCAAAGLFDAGGRRAGKAEAAWPKVPA
jgi:N-acetylneuraminate lyase